MPSHGALEQARERNGQVVDLADGDRVRGDSGDRAAAAADPLRHSEEPSPAVVAPGRGLRRTGGQEPAPRPTRTGRWRRCGAGPSPSTKSSSPRCQLLTTVVHRTPPESHPRLAVLPGHGSPPQRPDRDTRRCRPGTPVRRRPRKLPREHVLLMVRQIGRNAATELGRLGQGASGPVPLRPCPGSG